MGHEDSATDGHEHEPLVEGEPARLILEALNKLDFVGGPTSPAILTGPLRGESGAAFMRAMSRVEAELLLADGRASSGHPELVRTQDERRFDAMIAMVLRATDALDE